MKRNSALLLIMSTSLVGVPALQADEKDPGAAKAKAGAKADHPTELIAVVSPTEGNKVRGVVMFKALDDKKVEVKARFSGFEPNSMHGFHIHQFGDLTAPDGTSAGGHFNPKDKQHGLPPDQWRHAGDLGNLQADKDGEVEKTFVIDTFQLTGKHSILGRAVIVHEKTDTGEPPSGSAGARIAYGVIGYRNESG